MNTSTLCPALLALSALTAALLAARNVARAALARTAGQATADVLDGHSWQQLLDQSCALADSELLREEAIDALIALDQACFAMRRGELLAARDLSTDRCAA